METKAQLLQYFASLDSATLEKLKKYSQLLIIPDEDLLINATMLQMVEKAHELADTYFPEWTDRSKSDFGEFLIELFALYSEKDFWYINAFANEGILQKMRSYSNAFSKASSLGYIPALCTAAKANFSIDFAAGDAATYGRGDLVVKVGGKEYSNDSPISLQPASDITTKTLELAEGSQVAEDVTYNGYCVFLRKKNIDINSLLVSIGGVTFTRVNNFGNSNSDSTHFMVLPEEDGSCSIFFGQNDYGMSPVIGTSVHCEYRTCSGSDGNQNIGVAELSEYLYERPAVSATMTTNASGGHFADTLIAIKSKAPLFFNNRKAAINEKATIDIINELPFVHQSVVYQLNDDIIYQAIPESGDAELTDSERETLKQDIEPMLMLGYNLEYAPNEYRTLKFAANPNASKVVLSVVAFVGYNPTAIANAVRYVIEDLTNPLIEATYGGAFNKADVDVKIRSRVAGVQSVAFYVRIGDVDVTMDDVQLQATEIFSKITTEDLEINVKMI